MVYRTTKAIKCGFLLTERPFFYKMGVLGKYVNLLFYGFRPLDRSKNHYSGGALNINAAPITSLALAALPVKG